MSNESLSESNDQTEAVKEDDKGVCVCIYINGVLLSCFFICSALFDQPLVQEGKRKRKSTELFSFAGKDKLKKTAAPHAEVIIN